MKVSIIVKDRTVVVDGIAKKLDMTKLIKSKIVSVSFEDNVGGHIEYGNPVEFKTISDFSDFQFLVEEHNKLVKKDKEPKLSEKEEKKLQERIWRNDQLKEADIELLKVQDGRGYGSVGDWRDYRNELRDYPEKEGFPNCERPKSPKELN